ncbi:MAG: hypothetical protein NZ901_02445 [Geminocystis sp.]|nr:hypothetical protein [Geminocystis sp.]
MSQKQFYSSRLCVLTNYTNSYITYCSYGWVDFLKGGVVYCLSTLEFPSAVTGGFVVAITFSPPLLSVILFFVFPLPAKIFCLG